jgi:hypothetical protein
MKQSQKTLLFWVLVILMCIVIFNFVAREEQPRSVPFSEFVTDVADGKVPTKAPRRVSAEPATRRSPSASWASR